MAWYSSLWGYHGWFNHFFIAGFLGNFPFFSLFKDAAMNIHCKSSAPFLIISFRDTLGQVLWDADTRQVWNARDLLGDVPEGKWGRSWLKELCHQDVGLTLQRREEGRKVGRKSLRRKCSFKNILEIRWGVLKPKLPIRGSLHFLAAYLA